MNTRRQRLILKHRNTLRNRIHYAIAGTTMGVFIASGFFLVNHFGNTEETFASTENNATINVLPLYPLLTKDMKSSDTNIPQVTISNQSDSINLTLLATNTTVIDGADLKMFDAKDEKMQPRVVTIPGKLNMKSFSIKVSKNDIADLSRFEIKANLIDPRKTDVQQTATDYKWISVFSYNKVKNIAIAIPTSVKVENILDNSAIVSWVGVNNALKYVVRFREVGSSEWVKGTVASMGNKRFLVNLNPNTEYEVQVQSIIYSGKIDTSGYSNTVMFNTLAPMEHIKPVSLSDIEDSIKKK